MSLGVIIINQKSNDKVIDDFLGVLIYINSDNKHRDGEIMTIKHNINFSLNSIPISNFSESNKKIQISPKRIYSIIELEIISFATDNSIIDKTIILNDQNKFNLKCDTSYIEIKTKYLDENQNICTMNERKSSYDLKQNAFYARMLTDDNGFLVENSILQFDWLT